ncbi:AMIN domain-containing protein, partial [Pantanalinema rosaneae CENA516]|uniref:AMIN domain-containing protein n=1 Tax=Pantanalinema rosaneae TaxID=1620701 RepID=UPI003D6E7EF6
MDTVKSLRIFSLIGTLAPMAIVSVMPAAQAAALTHWNYDSTANQLEVMIQAGAKPRYFLMAQPARIVVDLPNTDLGAVKTEQAYSGVIRQIRVSQFQPGVTRMVLELSPDTVLAPGQVQLEKVGTASGHDRWVLRPLLAQAAPTQSPATPPSPPAIAPTTVSYTHL